MGVGRQPTGFAALILIAAGCGWSPSGPPQHADTCTAADGPTQQTVQQAISGLPPAAGGGEWTQTTSGHTASCRLNWVVAGSTKAAASTPMQVLFFDHDTPLGSPTQEPKPYITVVPAGQDTVSVQYQWLVGNEPNCCPTGIGSVRFQIDDRGKLEALDPIPNT
jgi:hypothetical protein